MIMNGHTCTELKMNRVLGQNSALQGTNHAPGAGLITEPADL